MERIAEVDEMLLLGEEIDGTNQVILPNSLIGDVMEEADQGTGTVLEGFMKVLECLLH